jgi:hypothetical protein
VKGDVPVCETPNTKDDSTLTTAGLEIDEIVGPAAARKVTRAALLVTVPTELAMVTV